MGDVETGEKSKKTKKKRFWPKVVLGVLLLLIAAIALGIWNEKYNTGPSGQTATQGEALRVGHITYKIDAIEITKTVEINGNERTVNEGGSFFIIDLTLRNHRFFRSVFYQSDFQLYANGSYYQLPDEELDFMQPEKIVDELALQKGREPIKWGNELDRRETKAMTTVLFLPAEAVEGDEFALSIARRFKRKDLEGMFLLDEVVSPQ